MSLNKELLDILACPKCKSALVLLPEEDGLECSTCSVVYPVKEDIPVMLIDQAIPRDKWSNNSVKD